MEHETIPKPENTALLPYYPPLVIKYTMYPFQSPLTLIKEFILYKKFYKTGAFIDDSKVEVCPLMCLAVEQMMLPMEEGGKLQNELKGIFTTNVRRIKLRFLTTVQPETLK